MQFANYQPAINRINFLNHCLIIEPLNRLDINYNLDKNHFKLDFSYPKKSMKTRVVINNCYTNNFYNKQINLYLQYQVGIFFNYININ